MRQSDGADLLGTNDPRSADIGIIYVAPDDTRQSVLTAILTQERLHRKEIALVLPERNNAFGRQVDFDGLNEMQETPQAATDNADDDEDNEIEFPLVTPPGQVENDVTQPRNIPVQADAEPVVESTGSPAGARDAEDDEEKIILIPPPPRLNPAGNYPVPVGASAPGVVPPANAHYPAVYVPSQQRYRRWWIAIPSVLLLLVIGFFVYRPLLDLIFVPQATVAITPVSKELKHTYTLTAVIGTPDVALPQVQARLLY